MTRSTYLRYEILGSFRNVRFVIFTIAWPLILFFTIASSQRHAHYDGISFPLYFMIGMTVLGTMVAVLASGARIALDRSTGWTRQMRITPLKPSEYLSAKLVCGYLTAVLSIVVLSLAGTALDVRLSAGEWLTVVGLLLVGLVPIAVLGIVLGHLLTTDSLTPAVGGATTLLALLGGAYGFQVASSGALYDVIKLIPSYWLVQAGKTAIGSGSWPAEGWLVIAVWTVVLVPIAVFAFRRDTRRA